jgi:hypothetical protein
MSLPIKKLSPAADAQARAAYQKLYETALPGQLLLEHGHADTIGLKKKAQIASGFVPLNKRINGFTGIKKYNADASGATDANGEEITVRAEQAITTQRMTYMIKGMNVLLAKNTRHAFLDGLNGCVYLEFSTPSMDEAGRFTDKRVIR